MAIAAAAASSLPSEGICCSISNGIGSNLIKSPLDGRRVSDLSSVRCKSPFLGPSQFLWLSTGHDLCLQKACVAADYSDSVPDSSSYTSDQAYHPLEDLKVCHNTRQTELSSAEIARTTVEANRNALLVFPGSVHCEPHEQISWAEFQYLIDDYGDIYFEISDDANILEDRRASNPVILESEELNLSVNWETLDTIVSVHPVYFAKCLSKAVNTEYGKRMDHPSNGVSILGYLRPAFADEESYLRTVYRSEDDDGYSSDSKDGENFFPNNMSDHRDTGLTFYRLEILKIELFSVYGYQSEINLLDFQDAEPDILVFSNPAIQERLNKRFNAALKALCKKKGLDVEGARLIGVDSLGLDVRVFSGAEVRTHRFPFKVPATSEVGAEKQIQQLLFPRSRRKKCMNSWRQA
ncbi:uncharacterized protein At3g49140 isoform X2 [Neltuma alba]|uniref:uncharacterized protein At3g49140 isoform X2 n=1 Tax=Neltuma alba TaxID=207710 RepID=UPI0010A2FBD2|nr:uncharacterized protein At3g49140 isoform X2 [Prosopis alba]